MGRSLLTFSSLKALFMIEIGTSWNNFCWFQKKTPIFWSKIVSKNPKKRYPKNKTPPLLIFSNDPKRRAYFGGIWKFPLADLLVVEDDPLHRDQLPRGLVPADVHRPPGPFAEDLRVAEPDLRVGDRRPGNTPPPRCHSS